MAATTQTAPSASGEPTKLFGHIRLWLALVGLVTILAGLLFGYDQGIISGALQFIQQDFGLSQLLTEVVTSWVTLGALVGALLAGGLADKLGRRLTLILAGALFLAGALLSGLAPGTAVLVLGRLVIGFGVGVASVAAPLYAAELAPAESRGRFVSSYQLAITIGILVAYIVDDILSSSGNWRLMLGGASVLGVVLMVFVLAMPESPRWLVRARRSDDAARVLDKVRGTAYTPDAMAALEAELAADEDQASWGEVFSHRLRKPLLVGFGLAVFQQITGINAIIYYADEIFAQAGFTTPEQQARATLYAVGVVNVLATFIAIAYVDRFGRKPLLRAGLVGMFVSLAAVGGAFLAFDESATTGGGPSTVGIITVIGLVVFIASFAFSLGPVTWTMISEIFPTRVRGRAIAVATAANWGAAFLVAQFFLSLTDAISTTGTFWLFALFCAVAFVWIGRKVPETKGRSLEEIEAMWRLDDDPASADGA
ncbi:MAG: sugar porter family MFS transporter [Acidimicrobiales bacterium]